LVRGTGEALRVFQPERPLPALRRSAWGPNPEEALLLTQEGRARRLLEKECWLLRGGSRGSWTGALAEGIAEAQLAAWALRCAGPVLAEAGARWAIAMTRLRTTAPQRAGVCPLPQEEANQALVLAWMQARAVEAASRRAGGPRRRTRSRDRRHGERSAGSRGAPPNLSRVLSKLLRHDLDNQGVPYDAAGFASIDRLLRVPCLREWGREDLLEEVRRNEKRRFGLDTERRHIRAVCGHSLRGVTLEASCTFVPPGGAADVRWALHGTSHANAERILREGIRAGDVGVGRAIHLAKATAPWDRQTRHPQGTPLVRSDQEVYLWVDMRDRATQRVRLYEADNGTLLTGDTIPRTMIELALDVRDALRVMWAGCRVEHRRPDVVSAFSRVGGGLKRPVLTDPVPPAKAAHRSVPPPGARGAPEPGRHPGQG